MFHRVRNVYPFADYRLCVRFVEGVTKIYDMKPHIEKQPMYKPLECSEEFYGVYADVGGYGIVWNDDIDLSCDELWDNGVTVKTPFDGQWVVSHDAMKREYGDMLSPARS